MYPYANNVNVILTTCPNVSSLTVIDIDFNQSVYFQGNFHKQTLGPQG